MIHLRGEDECPAGDEHLAADSHLSLNDRIIQEEFVKAGSNDDGGLRSNRYESAFVERITWLIANIFQSVGLRQRASSPQGVFIKVATNGH